jgi:hypothetical protein
MHQSPLQFVDRVFTMYRLRQAQHAFAPLATRLTATAPSSSSTVHPSFASFSFAARGVRPGRERERERERERSSSCVRPTPQCCRLGAARVRVSAAMSPASPYTVLTDITFGCGACRFCIQRRRYASGEPHAHPNAELCVIDQERRIHGLSVGKPTGTWPYMMPS